MNIKLIIMDVDGTLTDGSIYYDSNGIEIKAFTTRDGAILKPMNNLGIKVVFLTGRSSEAVTKRADDLEAIAIQGIDNKLLMLQELLANHKINNIEVAYIGDDLNDYTAMKICGFKACPSDAVAEIKAICDYVSPFPGGHGAVRDVCECILKKLGKYADFLAHYGVD